MKRLKKCRTRKKKQVAVWLSWICLVIMMIAMVAAWIKLDTIMTQNTDLLNQVMSYRTELQPPPAQEQKVSLGTFDITYYCPCAKCCGKTDGITSTGTKAEPGRTIAVDPDEIKLGDTVIIDDAQYIAEDVGGAVKGKHIDVFVESHQEAINRGRTTREVFTQQVNEIAAPEYQSEAAVGTCNS